MIYVNHLVYDFHDVPNALFLNKNIDDYSCDFHFRVHFFNLVINTRCSKKQFHGLIKKKINYNLNFWPLFKYLIILSNIFDPNYYA